MNISQWAGLVIGLHFLIDRYAIGVGLAGRWATVLSYDWASS